MPQTVTAVKCEQCTKLILSVDSYVVFEEFKAHHKPPEDARDWLQKNFTKVSKNDVAFCNEDCAAEYVAQQLKQIK